MGNSQRTSLASILARNAFGRQRFPNGIKLPAPTNATLLRGRTIAAKLSFSPFVGKVTGRLTPFAGQAILAVDVAEVIACAS